ncbi:Rv3654c family TadE-like protein [Phaeacidiphilus oryzae]|uniref:Rv3654c family TadE-like protein n=1 Tax=Phaeacidiphilus oryzae TaxID=348818 RepID=UPI000567344A|nr:Rv3654c family TadE-like protein [Phaeacidiphilus oryzae]
MSGRRRPQPEAGSATIWVLAVAALLALAGLAALGLGAAVLARHRAESAADLAALAAAERVDAGAGESPCARAEELVRAQGGHARLVACAVARDRSVTVAVVVPSPVGSATARARAAIPEPVEPSGPPEPAGPPGPGAA